MTVAPVFAPGTLWETLRRTTDAALAAGALKPIGTRQETLEDGGVGFVVRIAESLKRKAEDRRARDRQARRTGRAFNPFLPPEAALTVAGVSETHLAVLNKFNVVDDHLLIVTRRYEDQESLLNRADLAALWRCMAEYPCLGFYNGGAVAGASQPHKHLQSVPLPLAGEGLSTPMDPLLAAAPAGEAITRVPSLPFANAFTRLPGGLEADPNAADLLLERYRALLRAVGIGPRQGAEGELQSQPYNLLLTRTWMLAVPRTREHFESISVNALGYAGSLFVRSPEELDLVRRSGPMCILAAVSGE
jgi:ATP adenylyltransferase